MTARFLINIRELTIREEFRRILRPAGYLAAPAYLTDAGRVFAATIRGLRGSLIVDNGRFDDVGRVASRYQQETAELLATITATQPVGGRSPHSGVSPQTRVRVSDLARRVAETAAAAQPGLALEEQLRLNPTGVIGVEDITAATWLRLGLDINLQPNGRTALRRRNAAVARHAARVAAGLDQSTVSYLPVAGAMDYDTANDAGRVFAAAGLSGAAIGFGAYMADDSYTDAYKQGGRWHRLPTRMPQRYLRTVLVARGFWDGWNDETGGAPGHFHFLGLGAPIMIGLVAIAAGRTPTLTFDATSPIRDAVDGTFYLTRPAYLKIRARRIAERLIAATAERWQCHCPFCQQFTRSHPFDYPAGLAWRATRPTGRVSAADLRPGGGLYTAFPLLSEPGGGQLRKDIDRARIGHNHWTLQRIITAINTAAKQGRLPQHMDEVVTAYERASNAESFAAAVRFAHTLATEDRP